MSNRHVTRRAALAAGAAATVAGVSACSTRSGNGSASSSASTSVPPSATATVIATVTSVPIGGALKFTNPLDGSTGYLMQPSAGTFLGYSAVCSHQGCIVDYVADAEMFLCPCHGANYDAQGNVTRGPATKSLQAISVAVQGDNVVLLPG